MSTVTLTATQREAFAKLMDFRTQFVQAGLPLLAGAGIVAYGPGRGVQKLGRKFTTLDFARGPFSTEAQIQLPSRYDNPDGTPRFMYSEFTGTLSIFNSAPYETDADGDDYVTEEHLRELDWRTSTELTLFIEDFRPFASLLPNLSLMQILPIEPDERPVDQRECNITFNRFFVRAAIRVSAVPDID